MGMVGAGTGRLLSEKSVIVTGAGRGLGRSVALRVAAEGANVIVNDVDPQTAARTVAEIEARGGTAHPVVADVSLEADVESLVGAAIDRYGCLDLACNNALPEIHLGELSQLDVDDARTLMSVAMLGTAICLKHEIAAMEARGGAIVNISSIASVAGQKGTGFYAACKAGIEAMTRVAANENGRKGLRVNAIRAGGIVTPALTELFLTSEESRRRLEDFVPLGRLAEPEEVADVALFLLSDLSRYVTGAVLTTDGGSLLLG
jgi:3-oxoacyl-[acyl-carrier protein] reductase